MANQETFTRFWSLYPRPVGKQAALKVWMKIPDTEIEPLFQGLAVYLHYEWRDRERRFIPHAETWLRQQRWKDGAELEISHRQNQRDGRL